MTDGVIEVGVPWSGIDNPYSAWFLREHGIVHKSSEHEPRNVPTRLIYQDSHGSMLLLGCRAGGFHANLRGPGLGKIHSDTAIIDVRRGIDFGSPHGLQSKVSGLRDWIGQSSWEEIFSSSGKPPFWKFESIDQPDIPVGDFQGISLAIRFSYGVERDGENIILTDTARCITRCDQGAVWGDHVRLHRAVRDLLVLSRWHEVTCVEDLVLHKDDPLTTLDGKTHGEQWRKVVQPPQPEPERPPRARRHIIEFSELGAEGLTRWIALRNEFSRALDPIVSCKDLRQAPPQTLLAHTGPGMEALGYLLLLQDGHSEGQAVRKPLREKLARVVADADEVLPFDGQAWAAQFADDYNGLKHANRTAPDVIQVLNSWREGVLLVRAWTALTLGVEPQRVKDRLRNDPQSRAYIPVEPVRH